MPGRLQLLVDDSEPAEPFVLIGPGPQRRIARPQAPELAFTAPILERRLDRLVQILRQHVAHRVELAAEDRAALFLYRRVKLVGGVGEEAHTILDEPGGDRIDRDPG